MKVFTVGLDQKLPMKGDATLEKSEKAGSPPPGYTSTTTTHVPLPMGPEISQPFKPVLMRKSRGYKGILMVMFAVFLMAIFVLTLSEIAYNRQRDENFFKLRWAELKHRLGYNDYDYYHRGNSVFGLGRSKELNEVINLAAQPRVQSLPTSSTPAPILAEVIDTSDLRHQPRPLPRTFSSSRSSSMELQSPHDNDEIVRDARLQFLRTILQRIKQHAEDMGFDGTMQVSVIEVEPQVNEIPGPTQKNNNLGGSGSSSFIRQVLPSLLSRFPHQPSGGAEEPSILNVKSDAFLDGFGEIHQPSFFQNQQIAEQNKARLGGSIFHSLTNNEELPLEFEPIQWLRTNSLLHPDGFFRLMATQQQQPPRFPMSMFKSPQILPRPFEQWPGNAHISGNSIIDDGIEDLPQHQQQPQFQQNGQQSVSHVFLQSPNIFPSPALVSSRKLNFHQQQGSYTQNEPMNFGKFSRQPSVELPTQFLQQPLHQEVIGEMSGRLLQNIIANRINLAQPMSPFKLPTLSQQLLFSPINKPQQQIPLMEGMPSLQFPSTPSGQSSLPQSQSIQPAQIQMLSKPSISSQWWLSNENQFQQPHFIAPIDSQVLQSVELGSQQHLSLSQQFKQQLPPYFGEEEKINLNKPSMINQQQHQQQQLPWFPAPPPVIYFPPPPPKPPGQQQILQDKVDVPIIKTFIPPEDRIQVEPPTSTPTPTQQQQADVPKSIGIVDNNVGWTHQPQQQPVQNLPQGSISNLKSSNEDSMESFRNFQKMVAAATEASTQLRNSEFLVQEPIISKSIERPPLIASSLPSLTKTASSSATNINNLIEGEQNRWAPVQIQPMGIKAEKLPDVTIFSPLNTPVDFPAVKFPLNNNNDNNGEREDVSRKIVSNNDDFQSVFAPSLNAAVHADPNETPSQSVQQNSPLVHQSNPVFFQVDDPSSIEQPSSSGGAQLALI